ncbi:MAG: hypothetical protein HQL22_09145 [Candidatus Omnitrophica bacterium]|nr:hypothetical protein [Candidatus Omnitrophota bacterium]
MADTLNNWLSSKHHEWESLCRNCGACCGAFEDPCEHLHIGQEGKSTCLVYEHRLGPRKTVSGQSFNCINIRQKFGQSWPGDTECPYRRTI